MTQTNEPWKIYNLIDTKMDIVALYVNVQRLQEVCMYKYTDASVHPTK